MHYQKKLDEKIVLHLKKIYKKNDVENLYKNIIKSRKNGFGYINPIKFFFNSPRPIINFTKNLLKKRYKNFGFNQILIDKIFLYLEKNKNSNPLKLSNYIKKNIYSFKKDYIKKINNYIPVRYHLTHKYLMETYNLYNHKNIIDFGAGTNSLGKIIATANKKITVTGVDIMKYNDSSKIKNLFYKKQIKSFDIPNKKIDLIIFNGVLHHVDYFSYDSLLNNLSNKLNKNGKIILFEDTWNISHNKKNNNYNIDIDINSNLKFNKLIKSYPSNVKAVNIFLEWFGILLVRNYVKMSLPYNFLSKNEWQSTFKSKNLKLVKDNNIGFFKQTLHRQSYNVLVFEKNKKIKVNNLNFIESNFYNILNYCNL